MMEVFITPVKNAIIHHNNIKNTIQLHNKIQLYNTMKYNKIQLRNTIKCNNMT